MADPENTAPNSMTVENIRIVLRPIDPNSRGFYPTMRKLLATRRAMSDFAHALPEDVDEAMQLLAAHMVEPVTMSERMRVLNMLTKDEIGQIYDLIQGVGTVPPTNDAA